MIPASAPARAPPASAWLGRMWVDPSSAGLEAQAPGQVPQKAHRLRRENL